MAEETKLTPFEATIKAYLEDRVKADPLFEPTYNKPNKSIKECCEYITQEAKKKAQHNCAILTDDEVFGMAVHYYDEDSIKVAKTPMPAKVDIQNAHKPIVQQPATPAVSPSRKKKDDDQPLLFNFDD